MTEQEWLNGSDPYTMMVFLCYPPPNPSFKPPSNRKLRLFATACCWEMSDPELMNLTSWAIAISGSHRNLTPTEQCHIIRDLFNPFTPHTTLWKEEVVKVDPEEYVKKYPHMKRQILSMPNQDRIVQKVRTCPEWLTQRVIDLSTVAYERYNNLCPACHGKRKFHAGRVEGLFPEWVKCDKCNGSGRIESGELDQLNLLAIADAMEEAGCEDGVLLQHLRGYTPCTHPEQFTIGRLISDHHDSLKHCVRCRGTQQWLPTNPPHYRGCWVLDLILGEK